MDKINYIQMLTKAGVNYHFKCENEWVDIIITKDNGTKIIAEFNPTGDLIDISYTDK